MRTRPKGLLRVQIWTGGRPAGWIRSKEKREGLAWPCCCALNLQRRGGVAAVSLADLLDLAWGAAVAALVDAQGAGGDPGGGGCRLLRNSAGSAGRAAKEEGLRVLLTAAGIGRPWVRENWPRCCSNEERGERCAASALGEIRVKIRFRLR